MLQGSPRPPLKAMAEDDAQDAIYLSGGWQSRLLLSLSSDLPNEVDWAFNKLVRLSFTRNFFMGNLPGLQGALLDHATPFFDLLELHTSPSDFETTLKGGSMAILLNEPEANQNNSLKKKSHSLDEVSLFQSVAAATLLERVLQVLHIFRNLSFLQENALLFSRDHVLLTCLAKAIALPSASFFIELKKHAYDVFENMASLIQLRGTSDFYFACLKKCLFDSDRALILSAVRALTKLCVNPMNEKVILQLDALPRILELLLVPDEELVMVIMEFLYNFSSLSEGSLRIPDAAQFNIVRFLWKFVHWRGVDRMTMPLAGTKPALPSRMASVTSAGFSPAPGQRVGPAAMANQDPSNPFFNAALWLTLHHELAPGFSIPSKDFYNTYLAYCRSEGRPVLAMGDLIVVVKAVFKDIDTFHVGPPPCFTGFRLKGSLPVSADAQPGTPIGTPTAAGPVSPVIERTESVESLSSSVQGLPSNKESLPAASPAVIIDSKRREQLISHVGIHLLEPSKVKKDAASMKTNGGYAVSPMTENGVPSALRPQMRSPATGLGLLSGVPQQSHHVFPDPNDELRGIPLTALLVLRNLARHPDNRKMYYPLEHELANFLAHPRYSKLVSSILAQL